MTLAGAVTTLYSFQGSTDGADAWGLVHSGKNFYGTTAIGGISNDVCVPGCGTVYRLTAKGVHTVLYSFKGSSASDGSSPNSGLIDVGGTLYGTTAQGGVGAGTLFTVTEAGVETVLHSFTGGADGGNPSGGLIEVNGTIYGTASDGGAGHAGTVFSVSPTGTFTVLYSFKGSAAGDGVSPDSALINVGGTLYGTTVSGGAHNEGSVYKLTTAGVETVLYSFQGGADGAFPFSGLTKLGNALYGTTAFGGAHGAGTVYTVTNFRK